MSENMNEETQSLSESVSESLETPEDSRNPRESVANSDELPETPVNSTEDEQAETFPRAYVEKLRKESAGHRDRAKRTDELAQRLHTALVEATGKLADPRDLEFNEAHLDDPQALTQAIETLLADKPHLATRKPAGNIGQGLMSEGSATVSLGSLLRANAN